MGQDDLQISTQRLAGALKGIPGRHPVKECAIAFSGGLDSSLIAHIMKPHSRVTLYTVGIAGSMDIVHAPKAAGMMGIGEAHRAVIITIDDLLDAIPQVVSIIGTEEPVLVSFMLPLYFVAKTCSEEELFTGQGADELFAGYARYTRMDPQTLENALANDLEVVLRMGLEREQAIAAFFGKTIHCPYMDKDVVLAVRDLPVLQKITNDGRRKAILRDAAHLLGLPEEISERDKKAAQYSSGIIKVLKAAAKAHGTDIKEMISSLTRSS